MPNSLRQGGACGRRAQTATAIAMRGHAGLAGRWTVVLLSAMGPTAHSTHSYSTFDSGTSCEDNGAVTIGSKAVCEAAAIALAFGDTTAQPDPPLRKPPRPVGCSIRNPKSTNDAFLNWKPSGLDTGCGSDSNGVFHCLCIGGAQLDPPLPQPAEDPSPTRAEDPPPTPAEDPPPTPAEDPWPAPAEDVAAPERAEAAERFDRRKLQTDEQPPSQPPPQPPAAPGPKLYANTAPAPTVATNVETECFVDIRQKGHCRVTIHMKSSWGCRNLDHPVLKTLLADCDRKCTVPTTFSHLIRGRGSFGHVGGMCSCC